MLSGTHRGPTAHDYAIPHRRRYFFLFSQLAPRLTVMFGFLALLGLYSYRGMLGRNSLTTAQQTRRERAESLQGRTTGRGRCNVGKNLLVDGAPVSATHEREKWAGDVGFGPA
jgi:hypothetical protein